MNISETQIAILRQLLKLKKMATPDNQQKIDAQSSATAVGISLNITRSRVGGQLKLLVRRGWVRRDYEKNSSRTILSLTDEGVAVAKRAGTATAVKG